MAIPHAKSGEVIDVAPWGSQLRDHVTTTLIKTKTFELLRLALPAGSSIDAHQVPGEITVHCLEGQVKFDAAGVSHDLAAGQLLYLEGGCPHALAAVQDSSLLVTIAMQPKSP